MGIRVVCRETHGFMRWPRSATDRISFKAIVHTVNSVGLCLKPVNMLLKLWNLGVLRSIGNQGVAPRPQIASVRQSHSEAKDLKFGLDSSIAEPLV